jgi:ribonuclease P protein subunit RPR2
VKQPHNKKGNQIRRLALDSITDLFSQAQARSKKNIELSDRYAFLARKIAMKYKIKMPKALKMRVCKHCHRYLIFGVNCRVRLNKGKLVYFCLNCKNFTRKPIKPKKR